MISNVVKKVALPINNKLKKTAGENINSNNSLPRIALIVLTGELPCFYIIPRRRFLGSPGNFPSRSMTWALDDRKRLKIWA
jgi:hypothetical protein